MALLALWTLASIGGQDDIPRLLERLRSENVEEREAASRDLIQRGAAAIPGLRGLARDPDAETAGRARIVLDVLESSVDVAMERLLRMREEERASYQRLVWRCDRWLRRACEGRDWDVVWRSFHRQKATVTDVWDRDSRTTYRVVFLKEAYDFGGVAHDLFAEVEVSRELSADGPTRSRVESIRGGLIGRPGVAGQEFRERNPYPAGTVLALALKEGASAELPFLSEVKLTFRRLFLDRWTRDLRSWFDVDLEWVGHPALPREFGRSNFMAESLLDPEGEGKPGFVPRDVLGECRNRPAAGSGRWGFDRGLVRTDVRTQRLPVSFMGHSTRLVPRVYGLHDLDALSEDVEEVELKGKIPLDGLGRRLLRFKNLKRWDGGTSGDEGLRLLAALPALEHLSLSVPGASERGIAALALTPKLKELWLYESGGVTDEGLKKLGPARTLTSLLLYGAQGLTDEGFRHLAALPELRSLWIWTRARITDRALEHLSGSRSLRTLKLGDLKGVTAEGMARIARLPELRELIITYGYLDDACLDALSKAPALEYLEVYNPAGILTDAGVRSLKSLKNLLALHLEKTEVTLDAVRRLQAELPGQYVPY